MTDMAELPPEPEGWLPPKELDYIRTHLPMVYVDIVPVRMNEAREVTEVGLLLRAYDDAMSRALISGRVLYHERLRDALVRHVEKDLGPLSLPRVPAEVTPFMIAEYFPTRGVSPFFDSRQHSVSLAFVVPVDGECEPSQDALDVVWLSPEEAASDDIGSEMHGGQDYILRKGLASVGALPKA
jgi:ADP-ribose pyrophosphatase YjhB (NUDIX family)